MRQRCFRRSARALSPIWLLLLALINACDGNHRNLIRPTPTFTEIPPTPLPTATPTPVIAIHRVFPQNGPTAGDNPVLIEGRGFAGGNTEVTFGGAMARECIVISDLRLSCRAPQGFGANVVDVTVRRPGAAAATLLRGYRYLGGGSGAALRIESTALPSVVRDRDIGTTTVVLDFLVRDALERPIPPADLDIVMFLDGNRLGEGIFDEAVLRQDAEELALDLFVELVLDASFSLQRFDPPQFASLLVSAEELIRRAAEIWDVRPGSFDWSIVWFDELLAKPHPEFRDSFGILDIPEPVPGNFTKLYSAISAGLETSRSLLSDGVAAGPRDRHLVVVFTDGRDNLSSFDNSDFMTEGVLDNGDPYPRFGWRSTDLGDVLREISEHPSYPGNLSVHTIALGESCELQPSSECFDETALGQIAQVGFGQMRQSLDNVADVFDQITSEFTTIQSSGAKMALAPGEYDFELVARRADGTAEDSLAFTFRVTATGAEFLSFR